MKLEIAMTERDKKLLIFLSIFVLVVCFGYWGIRPSIKKINELDEQIAQNEQVIKYNQQKVMQLIDFETANTRLEEKIVGARENYFMMMSSDEVDRYFTDMALRHNLYVYSLNINMPNGYCELKPYQYSEKAQRPVIEEEPIVETAESTEVDAATEGNETQEVVFEEAEVENGIHTVIVTMSLTGEPADISKIVSELSHNDKQMRVLSYRYKTKRKVAVEEDQYDVVDELALDIAVEVYMCEE